MKYTVGDRVQVIKNRNRSGTYFPATIVDRSQGTYAKSSHVYEEKNIAAKLIVKTLTLGYYPQRNFKYDVKYDDGSEEKNVDPQIMKSFSQI